MVEKLRQRALLAAQQAASFNTAGKLPRLCRAEFIGKLRQANLQMPVLREKFHDQAAEQRQRRGDQHQQHEHDRRFQRSRDRAQNIR